MPVTVTLPSDSVMQCLKSCTDKCVAVVKSCGHEYKETCSGLLEIVAANGKVNKGASCAEMVTRALRECGHEVTVQCKMWQSYVAGQTRIKCNEMVECSCWNVDRCN